MVYYVYALVDVTGEYEQGLKIEQTADKRKTLTRRKTIVKTEMLRLAITALVAFSVGSAVLAAESPPVTTDTVAPEATCQEAPNKKERKPDADSAAKAKRRAASLHAIMEQLGLGKGAAVADIGAGNGQDTWVFAKIVGPQGAVYSEEIAEDKVTSLKEEAQRRELPLPVRRWTT